jgi:membrane-associated phospholipid phosphatase
MRGKDFIVPVAAATGTALLIHYDEEIDHHVKPLKSKSRALSEISDQYTELGDYYGYLLLAGIGGYSMAAHNYRLFRATLMASQAGLSAGLWIRVGKLLTSRMRPEAVYTDQEFHSDHWFGPFAQFGSQRGIAAFDAFPSGHTGFAFAVATAFSKEYSDIKAVPVILYSAAGLVGISRLVEHAHWASDVFLGGIIGYLCGNQVYKNEKRLFPGYRKADRKTQSFIYPVQFENGTGLAFRMQF